MLCIRQYLLKISFFTYVCNILMFCEFKIAVAVAGNLYLFIEILEKVQVVYGTTCIELFLAYHGTFGIFLIRAEI